MQYYLYNEKGIFTHTNIFKQQPKNSTIRRPPQPCYIPKINDRNDSESDWKESITPDQMDLIKAGTHMIEDGELVETINDEPTPTLPQETAVLYTAIDEIFTMLVDSMEFEAMLMTEIEALKQKG